MSNDREINSKAEFLEQKLFTGDTSGLQNALVNMSSQEDFNQVVDTLKKMTDESRSHGINLPELEIHKDGVLGFGNVDQVVLKQDGKKQEVFETVQHRQQELQEDPNSWGRAIEKMFVNDWVNQTDAKSKDSSTLTEQNQFTAQGQEYVIRDFRENRGQQQNIQLTPEQWEQVRQQLPRTDR